MDKLNNLLAKIPEFQARARQRGESMPLPKKDGARLPVWPEAVRAVPNGFLRSALFGAIAKGRRRYINNEDLAAIDGVTVKFRGVRLDQGDLDIWLTVLHFVHMQELGSQCRITSYALLKLAGKTDSGKNRATLQSCIERLVASTLTVKQGCCTYIGHLISGVVRDEKTQEWVIWLDPRLLPLFEADQFTLIDLEMRRALAGQPLAQWLHGFYASHAKPFPMRDETLLKLSGSENVSPRSARQKLLRALNAVAAASAACGEGFCYSIRGDLVYIEKRASGPQRRHLAKKPRG